MIQSDGRRPSNETIQSDNRRPIVVNQLDQPSNGHRPLVNQFDQPANDLVNEANLSMLRSAEYYNITSFARLIEVHPNGMTSHDLFREYQNFCIRTGVIFYLRAVNALMSRLNVCIQLGPRFGRSVNGRNGRFFRCRMRQDEQA